MSDELVRRNLEQSLTSSLGDLTAASETIMLLIDTSSSMEGPTLKGKRPIDHLRDVVNDINPRAAGIPMIAFGGPYDAQVRFVDTVPEPDGGTPLHIAIPMAKEYGANRVVVISDGAPDLREQCIEEAKTFGGRIDVVYIGDPGDAGEFFLAELARLTGGTCGAHDVTNTKELAGKVIALLEGEVEKKAPIQGPGFTTVDDEDVEEPEEDEEDEFEEDDDEDDEDEDEDDE